MYSRSRFGTKELTGIQSVLDKMVLVFKIQIESIIKLGLGNFTFSFYILRSVFRVKQTIKNQKSIIWIVIISKIPKNFI